MCYITIEYDGFKVNIQEGDEKTNDNGEFISHIVVPTSIAGIHVVTVYISDYKAETEFTVESEVILDKCSDGSKMHLFDMT